MSIKKIRRKKGIVYRAELGSSNDGSRATKTFTCKIEARRWIEQSKILRLVKNENKYDLDLKIMFLLEIYIREKDDARNKHKNDMFRGIKDICERMGIENIGGITAEVAERYKSLEIFSRNPTYKKKKRLSRSTKIKSVKHLKTFCNHLVRSGFLDKNPLEYVKTIRPVDNPRWALNKDECIEILRAAKEQSPSSLYPIIYMFLYTGLRKSELITLEWDDIDFESMHIFIRDKPNIILNGEPHLCKCESTRRLPIHKSLKPLLLELLEVRKNNFVISTKFGRMLGNNWDKNFRKAIAQANIQKANKVTAHVLRHTYISQLLAYSGLDIKAVSVLAGHKDLKTTQGYIHLLSVSEEHHEAVDRLPEY